MVSSREKRFDLYIHIGYGNTVAKEQVVAVFAPNSAPIKKLRHRAVEQDRLLDATFGRKTRSIIITRSNHVVLSSVHPETIWQRAGAREETSLVQ